MIRIPNSVCKTKFNGISESIVHHCDIKRLRVIHEVVDPIHLISVVDLETKFQQTFYMQSEDFVLNATVLTWIKKKMNSLHRGKARERNRCSI